MRSTYWRIRGQSHIVKSIITDNYNGYLPTTDYYYGLLLPTTITDYYYGLLLRTTITDYYYRLLLTTYRPLLTITDYY